jgi:hypothetical protein
LNKNVAWHTFLGDCFILALAKVDDVADEVIRIHESGFEPLIWGRDMKSCFRQIYECLSSWHLQCIQDDKGFLYFDVTALMGSVLAAMKAMRVGSVPLYSHVKEGHFVTLYIDDFTGVDKAEDAVSSVASFDQKLRDLNLIQNEKKKEEPNAIKIVLGIEFDCVAMEMRLNAEKLVDINTLLDQWPPHKPSATLSELRSLAGKLLNICKVVPQSRPFVSRILEHVRIPSGARGSQIIPLDQGLQADIRWWKSFLPFSNGIRIMRSLNCGPADANLSMDASFCGAGAVFIGIRRFATIPFPGEILDRVRNKDGNPCMNSLEMLAVLLVLRLWGQKMEGGCFSFSTDNLSTCQSLDSGRSKSPFRQQILREIALVVSRFNIHIRPHHLPSRENHLADALSRTVQDPKNFDVFLQAVESLGIVDMVESLYSPDIFHLNPDL